MSKAGEKRTLSGDDDEKSPFTDEQLAALDEPNKGECHCQHTTCIYGCLWLSITSLFAFGSSPAN